MTTETAESVVERGLRWAAHAKANGHRFGVLLRGERTWCRQTTDQLVDGLQWPDTRWFTQLDAPADAGRALLGGEVGSVVVDLRAPGAGDILGAAGGAIRRGGALVVWADLPRDDSTDRGFADRFCRIFSAAAGVATLVQGSAWSEHAMPADTPSDETCTSPYGSADQARAVAAITKVASGRSGRPAVLLSDRGRGKSAALGLAAARLLAERPRTIWLVAPSLAAVEPVFRHAGEQLGIPPVDGVIAAHGGRLVYRSPADLTGPLPPADLVLVDEAAALPLSFLERLLDRYRRLVFATTVHGYEGTGRGFALRFQPLLAQKAPGGQTVTLETPIRWAPGDPIEAALFDALLLNAEAASPADVIGTTPAHVTTEWVSSARLSVDETRLRGLFGLLVAAHHRTTPADLQRLLDDPRGLLVVQRRGQTVVGAAFVMVEGRLSDTLAAAVQTGRRRPHGHLLPEALWAHLGLGDALRQEIWRIVRIAVHPACRRVSLGQGLLRAVADRARVHGADCWGATFGVTTDLLAFWRSAGAHLARVGVTPGRSSGLVSAMVIAPLTPAGETLTTAALNQVSDELPFALGDPLRSLSADVALALLACCATPDMCRVPAYVGDALQGVADRTRSIEVSTAALWRFTAWILTQTGAAEVLDYESRALLLRRFLQRHPWSTADTESPARGRRTLVKVVANAVRDGMTVWRSGLAP